MTDSEQPDARSFDEVDQTIDLRGQEAQLAEILEEYLEQLKQGEAPSQAELKARHPELAGQLDACLAGLEFIHGGDNGQPQQASGGAPPRVLGDFRIQREIGRGGMGAVYEAEQISLQRKVALKVLRFGAVNDPQALDRFQREAETVAKLHHTNIVPVFSVGSDHGVNYYAMQLIPGRSLDHELKDSEQPIGWRTVVQWVLQAAEALSHAHQRGVIHRDVKPSNLILDEDGRIWLTDFGLAKTQDDVTLSRTGALLGTPRYMSPEQASPTAKEIDARTDIFSLGATLYELVTGQPAFAADSAHEVISQILDDEPITPRTHYRETPRDLETVILKCMAKSPRERYATMEDVAFDLRAVSEGRPIRARRPSLLEQASKWVQGRRQAASSGATVVGTTLLLLALSGFTWSAIERAKTGGLLLETDEPRLVAHLMSDGEGVESSHTIPTQSPIESRAGKRRLRVTGVENWGRTSFIDIRAGETTMLNLRSQDENLTPRITIKTTYSIVRTSDGARVFDLDESGVRRLPLENLDQREWFCELNERADPKNRLTRATAKKIPPSEKPWPVWPWRMRKSGSGFGRFDARPYIVGDLETEQTCNTAPVIAPDVSGDGVSDLILAARHQAWVMAISGKDGKILWTAWRGVKTYQNPLDKQSVLIRPKTESAVSAPPILLDDLDGDGVPEVCASFFSTPSPDETRRWIEVLSGANGEQLWQRQLDNEWFQVSGKAKAPPQFLLRQPNQHRFGSSGMNVMRQNGRASREPPYPSEFQPYSAKGYVNGRPQRITVDGRSLIGLAAGNRLVGLDPKTGDQAFAAEAPRPDYELRWGDLDGDGNSDAIYLREQPAAVTTPGNFQKVDLVAWSSTTKKTSWTLRLNAYRPAVYGENTPEPRWPLVRDLDQDGKDEVIVASESSYTGGFNSTPWGRVSVLEGTGKERWNTQIMAKDQQVNHFEVGPDINGDGQRDLFAVALWDRQGDTYAEAISGSDGETLWVQRQSDKRFIRRESQTQIGDILWRRTAQGRPVELIVQTTPTRFGQSQTWTTSFDVQTGRIVGTMMDSPARIHCADFDGDGVEEIASYFSKKLEEPLEHGGSLSIIRGSGARQWSQIGTVNTQPIADVNGDNVLDFLTQLDHSTWRMRSGADGSILWEQRFARVLGLLATTNSNSHRVAATSKFGGEQDINGDNVPDFVFTLSVFSHEPSASLFAISGATGKPLWVFETPAMVAQATPLIKFLDLDHDGRLELMVMTAADWMMPKTRTNISTRDGNLWMTVINGQTGKLAWRYELVKPEHTGNFMLDDESRLHAAVGDLDQDGVDDVVVPSIDPKNEEFGRWVALSGATGEELWQHRCESPSHSNPLYSVTPATLVDIDQDGKLDAALLQFRNTPEGIEARLDLLDSDGSPKWRWASGAHRADTVHRDARWHLGRMRPTVVRIGEKRHISLLTMTPKRAWMQLTVLDDKGDVSHQRTLSKSYSHLGVGPLIARDVDEDGNDELIMFSSQNALSCVNVDDELTERWLFPLARYGAHLPDPNSDSPYLAVVDGVGRNGLYLLDAETGKTAYKCVGPDPRKDSAMLHARRVAWLSRMDQLDRPPLGCHQWTQYLLVQEAFRVGASNSNETAFAATTLPSVSNTAWTGRRDDPRWVRPLPWAEEWVGLNDLLAEVELLIVAGLLSLTLVLAPAWFILSLIRARRFGMNSMLFGFVLVGFAVSATKYPVEEFDPGFMSRFFAGLYFAPVILFTGYFISWMLTQQWKQAGLWMLIAAAISGVVAGFLIFVTNQFTGAMIPGERYSFEGAWVILLPGLYVTAMLFAMKHLGLQTASAIRGAEAGA